MGDGNGDGVVDRNQQDVASVPFLNTPMPSMEPDAPLVFVSLTGGSDRGKSTGSDTRLTNVRQLDKPEDAPDSLDMPVGMIAFDAITNQVGAEENFSLYIDGSVAVNGYWKQDVGENWINLASPERGGMIVLEGNKLRLDFKLTDGGEFDADGVANGIISDPGTLSFERDELEDQVQSLYIAYYQRPADSGGLAFWTTQLAERGGDIALIAESFANTEESRALYGDINEKSVTDFINTMYEGLFNRAAEQEGVDFYQSAFINGAYEDGRAATPASLMLDILTGARGGDELLISNKLDVARTFTWLQDPDKDGSLLAQFDAPDIEAVRNWLHDIDATSPPSVADIRDFIVDNVANEGDLITVTGDAGTTALLF
jgi:hypothetical protein